MNSWMFSEYHMQYGKYLFIFLMIVLFMEKLLKILIPKKRIRILYFCFKTCLKCFFKKKILSWAIFQENSCKNLSTLEDKI